MLRSGNGQHRRPRQAPKFVVTAGATGAGIALPLLAATGAHAASVSTWDKVAQCESGGMWSANAGDGYYGGLGFTQAYWEKYGGTVYAERADLASRQQQIAVAEKVLDAEGPTAWPDCSVDAGLTQGGASPSVDPGTPPPTAPATTSPVIPAPTPSSTSDSSASPSISPAPILGSAAPSASPSATASPTTAPSPSQTPSQSPSQSSGRHAKPSAPVTAPTTTAPVTPGDHSGDRASRGDGHNGQQSPGLNGENADSYTVRPGDNLSQIASDHSVLGGWPALYGANASVVGANPDLILPGQHLTLGGNL